MRADTICLKKELASFSWKNGAGNEHLQTTTAAPINSHTCHATRSQQKELSCSAVMQSWTRANPSSHHTQLQGMWCSYDSHTWSMSICCPWLTAHMLPCSCTHTHSSTIYGICIAWSTVCRCIEVYVLYVDNRPTYIHTHDHAYGVHCMINSIYKTCIRRLVEVYVYVYVCIWYVHVYIWYVYV